VQVSRADSWPCRSKVKRPDFAENSAFDLHRKPLRAAALSRSRADYAGRVAGAAIVARGTWTYGGIAPMPVFIIETDYDFWFEIAKADGDLEPGEQPDLNAEAACTTCRFMARETMAPSGRTRRITSQSKRQSSPDS